MPRRLLMLNALLVVVAAACIAYIGWQLAGPGANRPALAIRPAPASTPSRMPSAAVPTPPGSYGVIASRNLFSPARSDMPEVAGVASPLDQAQKPYLYGVVLWDGAPIAYLEDPATKRVSGYRIGDSVAGGTLKSIDADHVVLARPEGTIDVRLHDPSKPKPAVRPARATAPASGVPGARVQRPAPALPGVIPPLPMPVRPSLQRPAPGQVRTQQPPGVVGRQAFPPNLLRRLQRLQQQNAPANAPPR